jgi:ABC-type glycerol-3-phosphate transport system substrate-binding protein
MKRKGLLILGALLLAACGSTSSISSSLPSSELDDGDLVFDTNGNIVFNQVELDMWSVTTGFDANTQDAIIAEFNDMYQGLISVNTMHISRYDMETLLNATMEFDRENAPDIIFSHSHRANEYDERGWLMPIDQVAAKAKITIDESDYVPSLLSAVEFKDHYYGLPQDVHSTFVQVRLDILEENDLPIPTNYQELVAVSEQAIDLAAAGNLSIRGENSEGKGWTEWRKANRNETYYPFPIAFGDMWVHEFLGYTAAIQNGAAIIDEGGYPAWNSQEAVAGLQILRDWINPTSTSVNKYPLSRSLGSAYDVGDAPFMSGNAIFKLNGPWNYPTELSMWERELRSDGGDSNILNMPLSRLFALDPDAEYADFVKGEGHAFMLTTASESRTKQAASALFSDWMVNNAGIEWARRGHLPALKSVENSSIYQNDPDFTKYIVNYGSSSDYVVVQPTPYFTYVDNHFKGALQQTMAESYFNTPIMTILTNEYEDCVDYIDLYLG